MLRLFNTLTGTKEEFKPLDHDKKGVRLYTCGPTVYNYAHIGNLRAYVFADVLRRTLEYNGYTVRHVMNITDIGQLTSDADLGEDKMVKALRREGKPLTVEAMREIARKYETAFNEDLRALNIEPPHVMPRASEHIAEDIELVEILLEKGVAYKTSDGIYFDISKFPEYGTRGGFKLGDLREGARVAINTEKKNQRDFALWKFASGDFPAFESPWGTGYPGWHIECSAMSRKYLGQPFDIHTGGIDHIPVHHQNEIAQSEAAYDTPLACFWMHNEFVNMSEAKMAKSGEDFITLQTLKDKDIHPLAYRYYLLQTHYRSPLNFSWEALLSAQIGYRGLLMQFARKEQMDGSNDDTQKTDEIVFQITDSLNDDLNTSYPIGLLWASISNLQVITPRFVKELDLILGLDIENQSRKLADEKNTVPDSIKLLAAAREDARRRKDFKKADELRSEIHKEGFEMHDTDSGPVIRKILG